MIDKFEETRKMTNLKKPERKKNLKSNTLIYDILPKIQPNKTGCVGELTNNGKNVKQKLIRYRIEMPKSMKTQTLGTAYLNSIFCCFSF